MHSTKLVFACACLGMLLFGISLITLGSIATPLQEKFQLDNISAGGLFSILPFGILAGSLLFGPFSDRYGYKIIFVLSCVSMLAGFQGIAFASSLSLLKVCIFLFGLGGGVINGATNAVVADISKDNKGANLSLLGLFFAIGALGMPFILGILQKQFSFEMIVSSVGYLPLVAAVLFALTKFPDPKQKEEIPFRKGIQLLSDPALVLIGFFLFCQSSFEGIINNWTTTFLAQKLSVSSSNALYALSLYVVGMAVTRLMLGSVFRNVLSKNVLALSFGSLFVGCLLLQVSIVLSCRGCRIDHDRSRFGGRISHYAGIYRKSIRRIIRHSLQYRTDHCIVRKYQHEFSDGGSSGSLWYPTFTDHHIGTFVHYGMVIFHYS